MKNMTSKIFFNKWVGCFVIWIGTSAAFAQSPTLVTESSMEIFAPQAEHVHGSNLVALPNGDLLAVWFQGSGERTANDVRLMGSRKAKTSTSWSSPFLMADTPGIPDCNPVIFLNSKQELMLVWIAVLGNRWENSILRLRRSKNYSQEGPPIWNWQDNILLQPGEEFVKEVQNKFNELPESNLGWSEYAPSYEKLILEATEDSKKRNIGWMTRIKPLIIGDKIILPLYSDGFNFSIMAISEDSGESWKPSLPLVGKGPIQPALAQRKNGELVAMLRDSGDGPSFIQQSISKDQGKTWTLSTKTSIPNTASVELLRLADERWLMVGNDLHDGRYRLALWTSSDEGLTWSTNPYYLENDAGKKGSFSYPSLIQDSSGMIHISYSKHLPTGKTIQYKSINPKNLK